MEEQSNVPLVNARLEPSFPTSLRIMDAVTIYPDGKVVLAEGLTIDDAARAFWDAVSKMAPGYFNQDRPSHSPPDV